MKLLLASKSETRRRMLDAAGVQFECVDTLFDEEAAKRGMAGLPACEVALSLAKDKAMAAPAGAVDLVLGSDQTLELDDGSRLGKPHSIDALREQLVRMSGRTHQLHSAAVIVENGSIVWTGVESVTLSVRPLSSTYIADYLAREFESVRWNAGGYRIEGPGIQLFDRIDGSHFAILGLPLLPLLTYLRGRGFLPS